MKKKSDKVTLLKIFTDGRGPSPDGHLPAFAWLREDETERCVREKKNITSNEAEYLAILSAVEAVPVGAHVEIRTDSFLAKAQLNGEYRIRDLKLAKLAGQIKTVAHKKHLKLKVSWVPRAENCAGKLL